MDNKIKDALILSGVRMEMTGVRHKTELYINNPYLEVSNRVFLGLISFELFFKTNISNSHLVFQTTDCL